MPAKIGGRVTAPAASAPDFWSEAGRRFRRFTGSPASLAPIALFGLAVVGMLWADGAWRASLLGLGPVAKLLVLPFLLYRFERSSRAHWVFWAFLISCSLLLVC